MNSEAIIIITYLWQKYEIKDKTQDGNNYVKEVNLLEDNSVMNLVRCQRDKHEWGRDIAWIREE